MANNAILMYSIFDQTIFSGIAVDPASKPENNAQLPIDTIIKIKYVIQGVLHHRQLMIATVNAMRNASKDMITSDVNCQVNSMSSGIDSQILS